MNPLPMHPNAPKVEGTGEIHLESADRAAGYWKTHAETDPSVNARTVGVYLRADAEDMTILDGTDNRQRAKLIADRLKQWKAITTT